VSFVEKVNEAGGDLGDRPKVGKVKNFSLLDQAVKPKIR
jgi:hypothetical protein